VVARLRAFMPDPAVLALGRALQQAPALDLRVNPLLCTRDEVLEELRTEELPVEPTPYSPLGIRSAKRFAVSKHPLYVAGKLEIQDESSQLCGFLVEPAERDWVVDFCAGAGGKTLLLGALMKSRGRLYAFDTSARRLQGLGPRLKRSGLSNLTPHPIEHEHDTRIKRLAGKPDRVLVDAPCTGTGTLRRNPDLKLHQTEKDLQELTAKQRSILAAAGKLPKIGGRLVYATCSLLPEENQQIVEEFLKDNPGFELEDAAAILKRQGIPLDTGKFLAVNPIDHGMDGFFAAALKRVG
jgi:16S rRNA (cytosine967-C5)-methyltransferase